jgi:DNA repair exonuclease SbcCD nuclease subunit
VKLAIITDLHFGARNDSPFFLDYADRFFTDVFFPYLKQQGIKTIINLGDTFDQRRQTNHQTLERANKMFVEPSKAFDVWTIIGNHDTFFRYTNALNAPQLFFEGNLVVDKPKEILFDGLPILLVPWIHRENAAESFKIIEESKAEFLLGHLEIKGYILQKGVEAKDGIDPVSLKKFKYVGSGHFHYRHIKDNITYFGCPYPMNWGDYGNQKGFHVLDTETRQIDFIPNPLNPFCVIDYTDDFQLTDSLDKKIVKLNILSVKDQFKFDQTLATIESQAHKLSITDKRDLSIVDIATPGAAVEDTKTLLVKYVDTLDATKFDVAGVKEKLLQLYQEAISQ